MINATKSLYHENKMHKPLWKPRKKEKNLKWNHRQKGRYWKRKQLYKKKKQKTMEIIVNRYTAKIWQPRKTWQIYRHRDWSRRIRTHEQTYHKEWDPSIKQKTPPPNNSSGKDGVTGGFYQIFKELAQILFNLFHIRKDV